MAFLRSQPVGPADGGPSVRRSRGGLVARARALSASPVFLGGWLASAAAVTLLAVILGSSPDLSGPLGPASPGVLSLLAIASALVAGMAGLLGWRVLRLVAAQARDAGARLHLRFVTLFAFAAVAPAVIVALFFGVLVTRGVESWFSARVQTVVENSATVARSYIEEQQDYISRHVGLMAQSLNQGAAGLADSPVAYGRFLRDLAAEGGFEAAYILDKDGRILARAEPDGAAADYLTPPAASYKAADEGDVSAAAFESADLFRALYRLRGYPDAYLYVVRPMERGIFQHLRETEASLSAYRLAKSRRLRIQGAFAFSYLVTVLLVLEGAIWLGMAAAERTAAPVARLVQAADRIAAGDLTVRVDTSRDPDEIAVLSRAFNRMTGDLREQQAALRTAHSDAESRRLFMEALLLGVSAGVVGLDSDHKVSVMNHQAGVLLDVSPQAAQGRKLAQVAPELVEVAARAAARNVEAEADVEVSRRRESRLLRVRAGRGADGLVLTFDDITRLVAAQRNAAWRDVARRIAHEIKNPLTPIQLSAERLRRRYRKEIGPETEVFDRCVETIIRQVGDIGRMVDEFSAFARMPSPKFAPHDMADIIRQTVFAQRVAEPSVGVEIVEPLESAMVLCDARIVGQALANVLKNAGEAVAARMAKDRSEPGLIKVQLRAAPDRVAVTVEDNGVGLPEKDRDKLTEPYVTTREKGTGLGLAIVKRILEDHGGSLTLTDSPSGPGALVILAFPPGEAGGEAGGSGEARKVTA
jgi:two-component system nitrogen regulation sensor histidine kinase NtrY